MLGITNQSGGQGQPNVLLFTKEFITDHGTVITAASTTFSSHNDLYNSYDGIRFTGRVTSSLGDFKTYYAILLDLTKYNFINFKYYGNIHGKFEFQIRKGTTTGTIAYNKVINYSDYTLNTWHNFSLNLSQYNGEYVLIWSGGYSDSSGNTSSYTQYGQIVLYDSSESLLKANITI